jgi:hypothetical protein
MPNPDCPQPESVVCPHSANGFQQYKKLILASIDGLNERIGQLHKDNREDHDKIVGLIDQRDNVMRDRVGKLEGKVAFSAGKIAGLALAVSVAVSVLGLVVAYLMR